ncbi:hypothetical protein Vafri_11728 [Volvox africanus]|uniref:Uncharacterized protein n=1 Tax=Volvox africanus TaxID=51714 RepID=A0A8J4B8M8_9CHLO|nr:hypothetical protein Vafri_11728 [Volvox africanus]
MDPVAYRTRARCRETLPKPARRHYCSKPHQDKQNESQGRRRLRKAVASDSQHEELNNRLLALEGCNDQDDSVASNEARAPGMESQKEAGSARKRKRRVLSSPTTSSADSKASPSFDDSDVVIVGEFQSNDRDVVVSEPAGDAGLGRASCSVNPKPVTTAAATQASGDDLGEDEELRIVGMVGQGSYPRWRRSRTVHVTTQALSRSN